MRDDPKFGVEIYSPVLIVFVSLYCARILRDAFGLRRVILGIFMPEGTIKKLADKGFGFIQGAEKDIFFHFSALEGISFEELREGQKVEYQEGTGPKGPRAENVTLIEG